MDGSEEGSCKAGMGVNTESSLVSFLTEESKERPFWVLYGKEGLGKTTMVKKVYDKPEVRHKFKGCAWITVTPHLQRKTIWKDILSQIDYRRKDIPAAYQDLVLALQNALESNKYLIVLDGICSMEAMLNDMLADKMPSKVVITTRDQTETKKIVKQRGCYLQMMSPFTEPQSWQLFLKAQLDHHPSPPDVEKLKKMCGKCEGVPLAVKLLGNLVASKDYWKDYWKDPSIDWYNELEPLIRVSAQDLLKLCYSKLLPELKKCLHYLALLTKDTSADIEADKLCNLWIAEEIIKTSQQAETYLKRLANLGLVQVQEEETPTAIKIKSCSLPHYVRDFCCGKAKEDSFKEKDLFATAAFYFDKPVGDEYDSPSSSKSKTKPKKKTLKEVQSILLLMNTGRQQDHHILSPKSLDLTNCKLLRALDFNWLDFRAFEFPQCIQKLAHLSYLSFRDCYLEELSSIQKLKSLETLDLRFNPKVAYMRMKPDELCKLKKLRSLYLPYKFETIGDKKLELDCLSELENLQNFVSTHCRANDLSKLKKLRYLAATIVDVKDLEEVVIKCLKEGTSKSSSIHLEIIDFRSPRGVSALSKLLACGSLNALHLHGQISNLSWPISDDDKLTEIFLSESDLNEDPMPFLGKLPKLQKLGLSNSAFLVPKIICRKSGFPQLKYLKLSNLHKLENWTLEERAMPKLSTLTIENCKSLKTLPDGLSTHLQELSILKMPETFTKKYETQGKDFSKIKHVLSIKIDL